MEVSIKRVSDKAVLPEYGTEGAAGADVRSIETVTVEPGKTAKIATGLAIAVPTGYAALLFPRSGMSFKTSMRLANSVGLIDEDYRGEIGVLMHNTGSEPYTITEGDKIGQLVIMPYVKAKWQEVAILDETKRGEGGFGSTGTR